MRPLAACLLLAAAPASGADALIEIPTGGTVKYEMDAAAGALRVDRFLAAPVAYPANYGMIPGTRAGDGDPLDILVITPAPVQPGAVIATRPIGILRMTDAGEPDDKIIAVPTTSVQPDAAGITSPDQLPAGTMERIIAFFRLYKQGPDGSTPIRILGLGTAAEAVAAIASAQDARND